MLALGLLVCATLLARGLVRCSPVALTRLERTCLTGAVALTVAPWLLFIAAWALGFPIGLPLAGAAMAIAGVALARRPGLAPRIAVPTSRLSWLALGLLFAALFHGHMFHVEGGGLYTGGSSYGDLALHATLTQRFAAGEISFASPLVAGQALTYPFLGDFVVACLVRAGWSMSTAFAVTGWIAILVALGMIQALVIRLFGTRAAATIAVWLIVLSGSAVGIVYALDDVAAHGLRPLAELPNYSHMRPRGVVFANFTCDFFLPQRALLAALPGFWAAAWAIAVGVAASNRRMILAGSVGLGLLPLLHVHSFLVGLGVVAWLAAWHLARAPRTDWARTWPPALVAMLVVAAPQLAWQFGHSYSSGFGRWQLGWLAPSGGWWWFWLRQWGLALVLAPVAIVAARRDRGFLLPFLVAAMLLFAVSNLYRFQPHDWDNMKFLVYAYMMLALGLAGVLARAFADGGLGRAAAGLAIVALTATGALSVAREAALHEQLASTADLALAADVARVVPPDARVLTSDAHNHLVPMLAGRAIVMGYRGWLWTHGIAYGELEREVARMFRLERDAPQLLVKRGVTHVYIGPGERRTFHAALDAYRKRYRAVLVRPDVEVFDVRAPAAVVARGPR